MIELQLTKSGILLPVQAQPGARRTGVVGEHGGRLKVAVTEPPEDGKANDAIVLVLAEALQVKRSQVALHRGASSRKKDFLITGAELSEIEASVNRLCKPLP